MALIFILFLLDKLCSTFLLCKIEGNDAWVIYFMNYRNRVKKCILKHGYKAQLLTVSSLTCLLLPLPNATALV